MGVRNKTIAVMTSGGIDSYVAYRLALKKYSDCDVIPVMVLYGSPYEDAEIEAVKNLFGAGEVKFIETNLASEELNNVPTIEKQEIFGRNVLIAFYGALLADEVWICSLVTEMNDTAVADKRPEWFELMTKLFSLTFESLRKDTIVTSPFASLTKSEVIAEGLAEGVITKEDVIRTRSCYDPDHHSCGVCSTCFKRWIALENNDIKEEYPYGVDPYLSNEYGKKIVEEMKFLAKKKIKDDKRFPHIRILETASALKKAGHPELQDMIDVS